MALGTLDTYLVDAEELFREGDRNERWLLTFAIPKVDWPNNWSIVPLRGAGPLATFPDKLDGPTASMGNVLRRRINWTERPGWVVLRVTYGYDAAVVADNSAFITMRTVLMETVYDWSFDTPPKPMTGRVFDGDKPTKRVYGVKNGPLRIELPYQIIRIFALLDEEGRTTYAKPLVHRAGQLNNGEWKFGGMTFATKILKFRGVALDYSRRWGTSASHRIYNTVFEFIEHPIVWPTTVDRYEWKKVVQKVDKVDDDAAVVGVAQIGSLMPLSATSTACKMATAYNFAGILGNEDVPKLIS